MFKNEQEVQIPKLSVKEVRCCLLLKVIQDSVQDHGTTRKQTFRCPIFDLLVLALHITSSFMHSACTPPPLINASSCEIPRFPGSLLMKIELIELLTTRNHLYSCNTTDIKASEYASSSQPQIGIKGLSYPRVGHERCYRRHSCGNDFQFPCIASMSIIGIKQSPLLCMKIDSMVAYICACLALILAILSFPISQASPQYLQT